MNEPIVIRRTLPSFDPENFEPFRYVFSYRPGEHLVEFRVTIEEWVLVTGPTESHEVGPHLIEEPYLKGTLRWDGALYLDSSGRSLLFTAGLHEALDLAEALRWVFIDARELIQDHADWQLEDIGAAIAPLKKA